MNNVSTVVCRVSASGLRNLLSSSPCKKLERPFSSGQTLHKTYIPHAAQAGFNIRKPHCFYLISRVPPTSSPLQYLAKAAFSTSVIKAQAPLPKASKSKQHKPGATSSGTPTRNKRFIPAAGSVNPSIGKAQSASGALTELSQAKVSEILGPTISRKEGNKLLRILQQQRITGTLDYGVADPALNDHLVSNALAWLRTNYPLDEDAAIIKRIEDEDFGIYKPQQNVARDGLYGRSVFESIRERNEKERERKEKEFEKSQAEEIRNAAGDTAVLQTPEGRAVLARRSESAEWVKRYKEKATLSKLTEPPKMSILRRLLPSGLFCLCVIGLSVLFAQNYVPPPRQARIWPDIPPAAATVLTLILMNIAVTIMWKAPPLWRFMNLNFIRSTGWPRPMSILGNVFSHQKPTHLIPNMIGLWLIGTHLHDEIGRGLFLAIFLSCGAFASFFSLTSYVLRKNLVIESLGSSGAIMGLVATMCSLHSGESFTISFLLPDASPHFSANTILIVLVAYEIFSATSLRMRLVDHWSHLGGYLAGITIGQILRYRKRQQEETEIEQRKKNGLIEHVKEGMLGPKSALADFAPPSTTSHRRN